MSAKNTVNSIISENKVAIFSKSYCPYCKRVKSLLLEDLKLQDVAKILELDQMDEGDAIQSAIAEMEHKSKVTVPQVYIQGKLVGGCDDVMRANSSGQLKALLN